MDERMCHIIAFVYRAFLTLGERNLVNQGIALSHTSESNVLVNKIQIAKKKNKEFWYWKCCEMDKRICHIITFVYKAFLTLGEQNLVNQGMP
jgi:hypothetical protein